LPQPFYGIGLGGHRWHRLHALHQRLDIVRFDRNVMDGAQHL
jgi:hypothetical protein